MHASWQPAAPDGAGAFAPSLSRAQYKERARLCTRAALAELAGEARTASARTRTRALAVCAGSACIAAASLAALYKHLLWQQTSPVRSARAPTRPPAREPPQPLPPQGRSSAALPPRLVPASIASADASQSLEVGPAAVETPLEASTELVAFPSSRSAERAGAATALPAPAAAALAAFQSWLPCDSSRGPCALPEHGTVDIGPALPVALCLLAALKLADILAAVWKAMCVSWDPVISHVFAAPRARPASDSPTRVRRRKRRAVPISKPQQQSEPAAAVRAPVLCTSGGVTTRFVRRFVTCAPAHCPPLTVPLVRSWTSACWR